MKNSNLKTILKNIYKLKSFKLFFVLSAFVLLFFKFGIVHAVPTTVWLPKKPDGVKTLKLVFGSTVNGNIENSTNPLYSSWGSINGLPMVNTGGSSTKVSFLVTFDGTNGDRIKGKPSAFYISHLCSGGAHSGNLMLLNDSGSVLPDADGIIAGKEYATQSVTVDESAWSFTSYDLPSNFTNSETKYTLTTLPKKTAGFQQITVLFDGIPQGDVDANGKLNNQSNVQVFNYTKVSFIVVLNGQNGVALKASDVRINHLCAGGGHSGTLRLTNSLGGSVIADNTDIVTQQTYYTEALTVNSENWNFTTKELPRNGFTITFPQKKAGYSKMEVLINDVPFGSVVGKTTTTVAPNTRISFLISFGEEGYRKVKPSGAYINYGGGTLKLLAPGSTSTLLSDSTGITHGQMYQTQTLTINSDYTFTANDLPLDTYNLTVTAPKGLGDLGQIISITKGETTTKLNAVYDSGTGITMFTHPDTLGYGGTFQFKIEITDNLYNQSQITPRATLKYTEQETTMQQDLNGVWSVKAFDDITVTLNGIEKNKYKVTLPKITGLKFEATDYVEDSNDSDVYTPIEKNYLSVEHGRAVKLKVLLSDNVSGLDVSTIDLSFEGVHINPVLLDDTHIPEGGDEYRVFILGLDEFGKLTDGIIKDSDVNLNINRKQFAINFTIDQNTERYEDTNGNKINEAEIVRFYDIADRYLNAADAALPHAKVSYNTNYSFKLNIDFKYNHSISDIEVVYTYKNPTNEDPDNISEIPLSPVNGVYTISAVTYDITVVAKNLKVNTYNVKFMNTEKLTFTDEHGTPMVEDFAKTPITQTVKHGKSVTFNKKLAHGFSFENSEVTANGNVIRLTNGNYVINNIAENQLIEVNDISNAKYPVTMPSNIGGITFTDQFGQQITKPQVEFNSSYSFRINVSASHSQSADKLEVYTVTDNVLGSVMSTLPSDTSVDDIIETLGNDKTLIKRDAAGNYVILNVTNPITVLVKNAKRNVYTISLPNTEGIIFVVGGIEITSENINQFNLINHGENFRFSLKNKVGFDISDVIISDENNRAEVLQHSDGFVIQNVSSNLNLKATGIKPTVYNIIFEGENLNFRQNVNSNFEMKTGTIEHATGTAEFVVIPNDGYIVSSSGIEVTVDPPDVAEILTPFETGSNAYIVRNVTSNITIRATGAEIQYFNVVLPIQEEGIEFYQITSDERILITNPTNKVTYDTTFNFEIRPKHGFDISSIRVSANNSRIYPHQDIYTLPNIRRDVDITVDNIKHANFSVKLKGDGITFYNESGTFPITETEVEYLSGISRFRLVANAGYVLSDNDLEFYVDDNLIEKNSNDLDNPIKIVGPTNGIYTISGVTQSVVLHAHGAKAEVYTLNFPNTVGAKFAKLDDTPLNPQEQAEFNSELNFKLVALHGFDVSRATITLDPPANGEIRFVDGVYKISSISGNLNIVVKDVMPKEYNVKFRGTGADFHYPGGTKVTDAKIKHGENITVQLSEQTGYKLVLGYGISLVSETDGKATIDARINPDVTLVYLNDGYDENGNKIKGTTLSETARLTYEISNMSEDITILVENVGRDSYPIDFPETTGAVFKNAETDNVISGQVFAPHASNYVFKVEAIEGYTVKDATVLANGTKINLIDGVYTLANITRDINITVENVKPTHIKVQFEHTNGLTYLNTNDTEISVLEPISVDYGSDFKFKITLLESHSQSLQKLQINANNNVLTQERGIYTIINPTDNITITATGVELNSYEINLNYTEGAKYLDKFGEHEIHGIQTQKHGDTLSFMVAANSGYNANNTTVFIKGEGKDREQIYPVDNVYSIKNIDTNYIVVVENIERNTYRVELRMLTGVKALGNAGNVLDVMQEVKHGDSLTFRLALDDAYNHSSPTVNVKGSTNNISPINGIYTVNNITSEIIVEVQNVKRNTYKINFKKVEGIIYRDARNKPFEGIQEIDYEGTFSFKIELMDAYNKSVPRVVLNESRDLTQNGGMYELKNINSDSVVSVENVKQNSESRVSIDIENLLLTDVNAQNVIEISRAYEKLSDEEKELVVNLDKLHTAQNIVKTMHHNSNGVTISGLDWHIRMDVIPMSGNTDEVNRLDETMKRRQIIDLYDISLWNVINDVKYELPYGQKVNVILPAPDFGGFTNQVVVHENHAGGIQYHDVFINDGKLKFETSSFSLFGVAAKKIPNYIENPEHISISLGNLADDAEIMEILKEFPESELDLFQNPNRNAVNSFAPGGDNVALSQSEDKGFFKGIYNWMLNNELITVIGLIILFLAIIAVILYVNKRKEGA